MSWSRPDNNLFIYTSKNLSSSGHIAAFDLDWTLIRPVRGSFPKDADDLAILPNRISILSDLIERGFTLAIFTNQKSATEKKRTINFQRVNNFINLVKLPMIVMMATGDDIYRKPNKGMRDILGQIISIKSGFYCGDAAGRPQDFSDSDKMFAQNSGIKFYTPEELFPNIQRLSAGDTKTVNSVVLPSSKSLVVMMGMPGSGKSTYYEQGLKPLSYVHVSQDQLKTKAKVISSIKNFMIGGSNIAIDATNPQQQKRDEYYDLAKIYGYSVTALYFVRNGEDWNKLRPNPVPRIAYTVYFKNLVEPTPENTPGQLYQIA